MEFALVAPMLITLLLGFIEFGLAFSAQTRISSAAREGARVLAVGGTAAEARSVARVAAAGVPLTDGQIGVSPSTCVGTNAGTTASVTITHPYAFLTTMFGASLTLTGTGVMRCEG